MFNEVFLIQSLLILLFFFYLNAINLLMVWYIAGLYLILIGLLLLLDNLDIFIGFLWLIDLGVGLVFFIFILHFSNFLYKKLKIKLNYKFFLYLILITGIILTFIVIFPTPTNYNTNNFIYSIWFFMVNWYDYYDFFNNFFKTDLNLLREIYFYNNSLEFIIINLFLLYGIVNSIIFFFLIKKIFLFLNFYQFNSLNFLLNINTFFFIRNQNLINQQMESSVLRVWNKNKKKKKNDF
jgi:hypothetical protein